MNQVASQQSGAVLIMGICSEGPYKYAENNFENLTVKWMSWGYNEEYIHPRVLKDIKSKQISQGTTVVFCHWNLTKETQAKLLRTGVIDHITYRGGYVSFTIFLGDPLSGTSDLQEKDHFLCRYVDSRLFKDQA